MKKLTNMLTSLLVVLFLSAPVVLTIHTIVKVQLPYLNYLDVEIAQTKEKIAKLKEATANPFPNGNADEGGGRNAVEVNYLQNTKPTDPPAEYVPPTITLADSAN